MPKERIIELNEADAYTLMSWFEYFEDLSTPKKKDSQLYDKLERFVRRF